MATSGDEGRGEFGGGGSYLGPPPSGLLLYPRPRTGGCVAWALFRGACKVAGKTRTRVRSWAASWWRGVPDLGKVLGTAWRLKTRIWVRSWAPLGGKDQDPGKVLATLR